MNIPFDKCNVSLKGGVLRAFTAMITSMNNECLVNVLTSMMCRHLNCVLSTSAGEGACPSVIGWLDPPLLVQMGVTVKWTSCSLIRSQLCWHMYASFTVCRKAADDRSKGFDSASRRYYTLYTC